MNRIGVQTLYLAALRLGGTVTLPEVYERAGAKFDFTEKPMREAVDLIEQVIKELEV